MVMANDREWVCVWLVRVVSVHSGEENFNFAMLLLFHLVVKFVFNILSR